MGKGSWSFDLLKRAKLDESKKTACGQDGWQNQFRTTMHHLAWTCKPRATNGVGIYIPFKPSKYSF